jgi:competence protein ComEA
MNIFKNIIDIFYYNRKKIILTSILLIIVVPIFITVSNNKKEEPVIEEEIEVEEVKEEIKETTLMIDIKGEVNNPGCYQVESDRRVKDVIDLAGGLTNDASTDGINLSAKLYDEMVIVIDKKEEVQKIETDTRVVTTKKTETKESSAPSNGKISINKASAKELTSLPGIGDAKAKSIVEYRTTNGPFQSIEDIKKVKGIGDSIFAKIKDNITL